MKTEDTRIFWCHPCLMDYRKPLFDLFHRKYKVKFFFWRRGQIQHEYDAIYARRRIGDQMLAPRDVIQLYRGIRKSDVFISSFLFADYSIVGIIIAKALGKKVIVWEEQSRLFKGMRPAVRRWGCRAIARYVDAFFVLGEPQRDALHELGVCDERIFIANEYPGHVYSEVEATRLEQLAIEGKEIILYLGRFIAVKGVDHLLEGYSLLEKKRSNTLLLIVGYGPLEESLRKQAEKLRIENIRFLGPINDVRQKKYLFEISRMLVVPSVIQRGKGIEGGPLVVLEALSAGTPVLGTDGLISSTQFIRDSINGFIVPHSDPVALCEKMEDILNWGDPEEIRKRVRAGFDSIKGFKHQFETMEKAIWRCGSKAAG